ncbi:MAG TPA: carboxypeptidase regulatory-like domain-containing protein [Sedimentisphaerales bacterium]|nr:carboxypeptidase regulatory-like domain-containing protein [Sedimentisphaerales bacterium]
MNRHFIFILGIVAVTLAPAAVRAALPADDFNDNTQGAMWELYEQDANHCRLEETNQRLEVWASESADDLIALYTSNRWLLDTTQDFRLKVDFHYERESWEDGSVAFFLTPSLTGPEDRIVAIRVGCDEYSPYFWYEATDGAWEDEGWGLRDSNDGTLYISYNSLTDRLYLSYTGYGRLNSWVILSDLLQGRWGGKPVYVGIGGAPVYGAVESGEAYLDNFVVDEGVVETPVSDHVFGVEITQGWDYGDPYDSGDLVYEFSIEVETDADVNFVEFVTADGNTFEIPDLVDNWSDGAWTTHEYDSGDGVWVWEYSRGKADMAHLQDFGDGWYTIKVNYVGGGQGQTSVWFGKPDGINPIPQPMQEPYLNYPWHRSSVDSPVTFDWWWCYDQAATLIWMGLENEETGEEIESTFNVSETNWGPVALADGFWEADLAFAQFHYTPDNGDGIEVSVGKYSESDYEFAVGGFTISGRVTDKNTLEPLENIRVGCWNEDYEIWNDTYTDINGYYTLTNIQPGQVQVRAEPETYYAGMGTEFVLTEDVYGLDFALSPAATLSGKVIDAKTAEPIADVEVTYSSDRYSVWKNDFSDSNGAFSLTNLPSGMAEVKARPRVDSGYGWNLPWGGCLVSLAEGEHRSNRIITLQKGAMLTGYIKDVNGVAVSGAEYNWNSRMCEGWGDADINGRYQIRLPVGTYVIGPDEDDFGALRMLVTITDINQPVNVNDIIVYTEETGGQISGNVNNPSGYPKSGDFIIIAFETGTVIDANTWYTIEPIGETGLSDAGPFTIRALPPAANYDIYLIVVSETPDEIMSLAVRDSAINVGVGTTGINLDYNSEGSTVSGRVINTYGRAVLGATVLLNDPCTGAFAGFWETDPNGEYIIYNFAAGTYTATAVLSKYADASATVEVVDDVPADIGTIVMAFAGEKEGADLNGDGFINMFDYAKFGSQWRKSGPSEANFNQDGEVEFADLRRVAENWLWQAIWLH